MATSGQARHFYAFGHFRLYPGEYLLARDGQAVPLPPRVFDTLALLVENSGHLIEKEELMKRLWPDAFVEEANLTNNISLLRKALGETADEHYIETVPRRGYRFVAPVSLEQEESEQESAASMPADSSNSPGVSSLRKPGGAMLAVFGLALAAVVSLAYWWSGGQVGGGARDSRQGALLIGHDDSESVTPFRTTKLTRLTSDVGLTTDPAISPDGALLAYASDRSGEGNLDIWVQPVTGGEQLRLTYHEVDDCEPAFSPDGSKIAFRSERDGGGIYVVPTFGGEARLIARQGRRPRFSPDGSEIAYWTGMIGSDTSAPGDSKIYIVAAGGGPPRQLQPDFATARAPVWAPDGKHILFFGVRNSTTLIALSTGDQRALLDENIDWWVTPLVGGAAVKTGTISAIRRQGLMVYDALPGVWDAEGNRIVFSVRSGDSTDLWWAPISPQNWQVTGSPQGLTLGVGQEVQPCLAAGGRLVFSGLNMSSSIWSLPIAADQGKVVGQMQQLAAGAAINWHPFVSADGKRLVFLSDKLGNIDVWLKNLVSGKESPLTNTSSNDTWPMLSADGSKVAYVVRESQKTITYTASVGGDVPKKVCEDCGRLDDWSSDQKKMLYHTGQPRRVVLLDVPSGVKSDLLIHPEYNLYQPHFSPDDRWITFLAQTGPERRRLFIAPFREGKALGESEWIAVTDGQFSDDKPRFSPNGNLLYFTSNRDGFLCLWAQRLDPATKRPVGASFAVYHFHSARLSMLNQGLGVLEISIARDKVVFNLGERTGNIWMAMVETKH